MLDDRSRDERPDVAEHDPTVASDGVRQHARQAHDLGPRRGRGLIGRVRFGVPEPAPDAPDDGFDLSLGKGHTETPKACRIR